MNSDWLQRNLWSLVIAGITLVSTYSLYGYRIVQLEAKAEEMSETMRTLNVIQQDIAVIKNNTEHVQNEIAEIKEEIKDISEEVK